MVKSKTSFAYQIPKRGDKWRSREALFFQDHLPECAKRVGWMLIDRCNPKTGQCDPGGARIAWDSGLKKAATWKGIKALCDAGLIARTQDGRDNGNPMVKGDWRRNSYRINWQGFNALHVEIMKHRKAYRTATEKHPYGQPYEPHHVYVRLRAKKICPRAWT